MRRITKILFGMGAIGTAVAQMPGAPPPTVQVEKVTTGIDKVERRSIGLVEPINTVLVRTAVEGYLIERAIEEGDIVEKGQVLFRIDPVRYEAAVEQAQASLDQLAAKMVYAQGRYERLSELIDTQATSKEDKETAFAQLEEIKATKLEAEAKLIQAKKDLADCTITAAITGRLGSFDADKGNYINRGSKLATLVQIDPIYVRFPLSQSDVMGVFNGPKDIRNTTKVKLRTPDGIDYSSLGQIAVVDNQLEGSTDSYTLWAEFNNADGRLTPLGIGALYVSLKDNKEVCMVPLTAVHYSSDGAYCYVLDDKNVVSLRPITIGGIQGRMQTVYTGLKEGETLISDGAHKTRPGSVVNPAFANILPEIEKVPSEKEPAIKVKTAPVTYHADNTVLTSHGARVESIHTVEITPQVQGELEEPQFKEGAIVNAGQILFQIDTTRYQAAFNAQQARITQLDIKIEDAKKKFERQQFLASREATSKDELESAEASLKDLIAQKDAANALQKVAQDDLNRCTIKAPMDALIGRTLVTGGNYITTPMPIASLVQMSPIYVRFSLSENEILSQYGNTKRMKEEAELTILTATGERLPSVGSIAFVDNIIHTGTDTQNCWAIFENDERLIQPGGVVTVQMQRKQDLQVMTVPSEAIMHDNTGRYVYVVQENRAIIKRVITGTASEEGFTPIYGGLDKNDQVILNNQISLLDGSPIIHENSTDKN